MNDAKSLKDKIRNPLKDKKQLIKYGVAAIAGAFFGPHVGAVAGEIVGLILPLFGG